jgi:hypothetical protein
VLLIVCLLSALLGACNAEPELRRSGPQATTVAVDVPGSIEHVQRRLLDRLRTRLGDDNDRYAAFELVLARHGESRLMPNEASLARWRALDPALDRFLALEPLRQRYDLYLFEPTGTLWWDDEYLLDGEPVEFRASYLIHLDQPAPERTRIEVIQLTPQVRLGLRWKASRHGIGLPVQAYDIRAVAPTTADRRRLLKRIEAVLADDG